ncbi:MAG: OsmC family protein [Crocinitomicaceae bacterium]|nr:OsmC family protein [Crocinitomicaceae bacterium]
MKVELKRLKPPFNFEAFNENGQTIKIDGAPDIGGHNNGFRPMELLVSGLGGCAAIDVVLILEKQKQRIDDLEIVLNAERRDEIPKIFTKIEVAFLFKGELEPHKVQRAIDLTMEKYCSVTRILEATCEITTSFKIN